jgi:succinoglycan biosynthesis protein ExoL
MKLLYLVHDLCDPAVARRVRMLRAGGAAVTLIGFNRTDRVVDSVEGSPAFQLTRTRDARLLARAGSVLRCALSLGRWRAQFAEADVIMARQLEMLVLAKLARARYAPRASLVFECLDIHRLMTGRNIVGTALRSLERSLLRACNLLVVSSPAFVSDYFVKTHPALPPTCLVENKVLQAEVDLAASADGPRPSTDGAPWRIGWFGVIRCRRSLDLLAELVRRLPGRVEVRISGKIGHMLEPVFDSILASTPGLVYLGPYDRARDLPRLYGDVHFTWAIDFYEAGGNSDWLLPNRLYEGGVFHAVPLADARVETGRWLARHQAGVLFEAPLGDALGAFFAGLDGNQYQAAKQAMLRLPRRAFVYEPEECTAFAARLAGLHYA